MFKIIIFAAVTLILSACIVVPIEEGHPGHGDHDSHDRHGDRDDRHRRLDGGHDD